MKKSKKILALIMSLIMLMSATSVGLVANAASSKSTYTGTALGSLNSADKYNLTNEQYVSALFDFADNMLVDLNLMHTAVAIGSVKIDVDLTSLNGINRTITGVYAKLGMLSSFIGDLANETSGIQLGMFSANTYRDGTGARDVALMGAFVSFLSNSNNANIVKKLIQKGLGGDGVDIGMVSNFLPASVTDITDDIVGFLKETLFKDRNAKFDTEISNMLMDLVNNLNFAPLAEFKITSNSSIYSLIDSAARSAINWALKQCRLGPDGEFKTSVKDAILKLLPTFETDYPFVNLDGFNNLSWDWSAHGAGTAFSTSNTKSWLVYQVNDFLGMILSNVLPEFTGWKADNSTSSLTTFDENIAKLAKYANDKLNPEDSVLDSSKTYSTKVYAMVLANFVIKMFLPSLSVSDSDILAGNVCKLAVQALNEFMSYYMPENVLNDLYEMNGNNYALDDKGHLKVSSAYTETKCKTVYKQQLAQIAAQFTSAYFPVTFRDKTSFDTVLYDLGAYFVNDVAESALGTVGASESIYTAFDRIVLSINSSGGYINGASSSGGRNTSGILPQGTLPSAYNTSKKVIDLLFSAIENLSLGSALKLLVPNTSNTEMTKAVLPNLLSLEAIRIVNKLFPGTWTKATESLDALITNENLGNILYSIMTNLSLTNHIYPLAKAACTLLGLTSSQKKGDANVSLAKSDKDADGATIYISESVPVIYNKSNTLPGGYFLKIENTSSGINAGYSRADRSQYQDSLYNLKVNSVTCENVSTVKVEALTSSNSIIASGANVGLAISGSCPLGTTLQFLVKYQMSNENGTTYSDEQEARMYVYYGSRTTTSLSSNGVTVEVPTKVYASPSTLTNTLADVYAGSAENVYTMSAETSVAPKALTDKGYEIKFTNPGAPTNTSANKKKYSMFSVSNSVKPENYSTLSGTYSINYNVQTRDSSVADSAFGAAKSTTISLVLFNDFGLASLVNQYMNLDLQSVEFSSATQLKSFLNELAKAYAMVYNPSATATGVSALESAFKAEAQALETAYNKVLVYQVSDAVTNLKQRIEEYSTGTEEQVAKYRSFDYTPVSWARYSSTMSTLKGDLNSGVTSSLVINEHLRYNVVTANRLVLKSAVAGDSSKTSARKNLQTVYDTYSNILNNNSGVTYTTTSKEALEKALATAADVLAVPDSYKASDMSDARSDILAGVNELTVQPLTVAALESAIDDAEKTYNDNSPYTDEAWEAYLKALSSAQDIVDNPYNYVPADPTSAQIAEGNAKVNELKTALADAIQYLTDHPFISDLVSKQYTTGVDYGHVYGESANKIVAGKYTLDNNNYIIAPYGITGNELKNMTFFELTSNKSRYFNDEGGKLKEGDIPKTYTSTFTSATCYNDRGSAATGAVRSGYTFVIKWSNGSTTTYNIVVAANPTKSSVSNSQYTRNGINLVGQYLPQVLNGTLAEAKVTPELILACDINGDGEVDNTDLVCYNLYEAGKWSQVLV